MPAFPTLLYGRISPEAYDAEVFHDVTIQKGRDLTEQHIYNGSLWRCAFTLITRSDYERQMLRSFYNECFGAFTPFTFIAPDDRIMRSCRFEEYAGQRTGPKTWEYRIVLLGLPDVGAGVDAFGSRDYAVAHDRIAINKA